MEEKILTTEEREDSYYASIGLGIMFGVGILSAGLGYIAGKRRGQDKFMIETQQAMLKGLLEKKD